MSIKTGIDGENASLGILYLEMIKLDESDASRQLVDYFKINKPNQGGISILAVVWDTEHDGNYEMIYSSLFEDSDQPGPVQMISFLQYAKHGCNIIIK